MSQAEHACGFRIMRMARPQLAVDTPLKLDLNADVQCTPDGSDRDQAVSTAFADRIYLHNSSESCGLTGLMAMQMNFGNIYLGETFTSFVSVCNMSTQPVSLLGIKVEIVADRVRNALYDNTNTPTPLLAPSARHDFIIRHDIKSMGKHDIACSVLYTHAGERRHLPMSYTFQAHNPLFVRTKTRSVGDITFLEATLENSTKSPMLLGLVRFDAGSSYTATPIRNTGLLSNGDDGGAAGPLAAYIASVPLLQPGQSMSFLFKLSKAGVPDGGSARNTDALPTLGRMEIQWKGPMGEPGRLQTQPIQGSAVPVKLAELRAEAQTRQASLHEPFTATVSVSNHSDEAMQHLRVGLGAGKDSGDATSSSRDGVILEGVQSLEVGELAPRQRRQLVLRLVSLSAGLQRIRDVMLTDARDGLVLDSLQLANVFVNS